MLQAHSLEYLAPYHAVVTTAAALAGADLTPQVQGATRLVGYGNTKHGYGPACLIDLIQTPYVAEPHVIWFPWVSTKDKIINFKWAMDLMAQSHTVLLNVEKKHIALFEHFTKQKYLRKIGYIENLPIVQEIHMYQVNRRKA